VTFKLLSNEKNGAPKHYEWELPGKMVGKGRIFIIVMRIYFVLDGCNLVVFWRRVILLKEQLPFCNRSIG
jgi:hypothetical protein